MAHDPVTPALRLALLMRDGGCVAPRLDPSLLELCSGRLTLDHVREHAAMGGRRAPSDMAHMVVICENHHLYSGWATSHRPLLREYLTRVNG
jgi:hypothetical protein